MPRAVTQAETLLNGMYCRLADDEWRELSVREIELLDALRNTEYSKLWDEAHDVAYLDCINEYLQSEKETNPKRKGHGRRNFHAEFFSDINIKAFDRWFTEYSPSRGFFNRFRRIPETREIEATASQVAVAFERVALRWIRLEVLKSMGKSKKRLTNAEYIFLQRIHENGIDVVDWYRALPTAEQVESPGTFAALMTDWGRSYRLYIKAM